MQPGMAAKAMVQMCLIGVLGIDADSLSLRRRWAGQVVVPKGRKGIALIAVEEFVFPVCNARGIADQPT
jgi:hypothetical protein